MSTILRIALILVCVVACAYVLRKIRRAQMEIDDAIYWIVVSVVLVIISICPQIPDFFSDLLEFNRRPISCSFPSFFW